MGADGQRQAFALMDDTEVVPPLAQILTRRFRKWRDDLRVVRSRDSVLSVNSVFNHLSSVSEMNFQHRGHRDHGGVPDRHGEERSPFDRLSALRRSMGDVAIHLKF